MCFCPTFLASKKTLSDGHKFLSSFIYSTRIYLYLSQQRGSFWSLINLRRLSLRLSADLALIDEDEGGGGGEGGQTGGGGLNLASLLSNNAALEHLGIEISRGFAAAASVRRHNNGLLRRLLQDDLPLRLRSIAVHGDVIENLNPAAFKVSLISNALT